MIHKRLSKLLTVCVFLSLIHTCLAQPANDNCVGAIALTPSQNCNPVTGTVAGATQSMAGCTGTANDDVWYKFVANQTSLSVTVTGSTGFDAVVQVFSGGCTLPSSFNCVNSSPNGGAEIATMNNLVIGVTYWVRVYHFAATNPSTPTFNICVSAPVVMPSCASSPPAGNTCQTATFICNVNGYCGNTSASYTADYWPELGSAFCGSIENNSFIQFVADASTVSLNVWVTSSTDDNGIQILIFSANNCSGPVTAHTCISPVEPAAGPTPVIATGLTPGNVYYMMIDGFAGDVCDYIIGVNSGIQVSGQINASTTNICLGGSVTLTASGGNGVYNWGASPDLNTTTGSVVIATPTTAGPHTYTMTSTSSNPYCPPTSTTSITINVGMPPAPNAGIDDSVCFGDQIHLSGSLASSSNSFLWQYLATGISPTPTVNFSPNFTNLNPTVTVNQPGLYRFILRETNTICGATARDTVRVLVMNPTQTLSSVSPSCVGMADGQITINNPQATQYSFDGGTTWQSSSTATGFSAGTYTVCSKTAIDCDVCSDITVVDPAPITIDVSSDTLICQNGSADLVAVVNDSGLIEYHWSHTTDVSASQTVNPEDDGEYYVYGENEYGCLTETDTIFVGVRSGIAGTITDTNSVCPGFSSTIVANPSLGSGGPYNFVWSNGTVQSGFTSSITVSPDSSTTYSVSITDQCESSPFVMASMVEVLPLPEPLFSSVDNSLCEPATFQLVNQTEGSMVGNLYWEISDGQIFLDQQEINVGPLNSGLYDVQMIVTSPDGCIDSVTVPNYLTVYPKPHAGFNYSPNPVTMFNTTVQLTNNTTNATYYQWTIPDGIPSYSESEDVQTVFPDGETGQYEVMLVATSEFNCVDTVIHVITVNPEVLIYAPNSFTPDDDEFNQTWGLEIEGIDIYNFNLLIFNRWGQIVWESHDPDAHWDGTYNGEIVQDGTYIWTLEVKDLLTDAYFKYSGHFTVIR